MKAKGIRLIDVRTFERHAKKFDWKEVESKETVTGDGRKKVVTSYRYKRGLIKTVRIDDSQFVTVDPVDVIKL